MRVFAISLVLIMVVSALVPDVGNALELPSWHHPLGTDAFGRDLLHLTINSCGATLLKSTYLTGVALAASLLIALSVQLVGSRFGGSLIRAAVRIVESCPIILWIFIIIIVLFKAPTLVALTVAFAVAVVPTLSVVVSDEYERQSKLDYVLAARSVGVPEVRILSSYVIPNMMTIIAPATINIFAVAMMIEGAVGLVGMGNRSELDIGILILVAKENFLLAPWIAGTVIVSLGYIYFGLYQLRNSFNGSS